MPSLPDVYLRNVCPVSHMEDILTPENRDAVLSGLIKAAKGGDVQAAKMVMEWMDRHVETDLAPVGFESLSNEELLEMAEWVG